MKRRLILGLALATAVAPAASAQDKPIRLVTVGGALTEIVYALGAESQLVGVDTTSLYPPAARSLPQVGYMRALSAEGVLSLKPSLVVTTTAAGPATTLDQLRAAGIETVVLPDRYDYDSVIAKVEALGRITGKESQAAELVARGRADMDKLSAGLAGTHTRPRVLFLLAMGSGAPQAAGQNTAADGIIHLAGGVNAVEGYAGYRPLTPEAVIASRADYIVVTQQTVDQLGGLDAVLDQPTLRQTPAGRAGKVLSFDTMLLLGFGPRTPQAARQLAAALHPELAAAP